MHNSESWLSELCAGPCPGRTRCEAPLSGHSPGTRSGLGHGGADLPVSRGGQGAKHLCPATVPERGAVWDMGVLIYRYPGADKVRSTSVRPQSQNAVPVSHYITRKLPDVMTNESPGEHESNYRTSFWSAVMTNESAGVPESHYRTRFLPAVMKNDRTATQESHYRLR